MLLETWMLFCLVCIVPAFTPGPAVVLAIANTVQHGAKAAFYSSLGNALGMLLIGLSVSLGLGAILMASATAFLVLKTVSTLYLVWLGIKMFRDRSLSSPDSVDVIPRRRLFCQAFVVSITNPKAVLLFAALLPAFVSTDSAVIEQGAILSATLAVITIISHRCYAIIFGRARAVFSSARGTRLVRRVMGTSLVGFGLGLSIPGRD